MWFPSFVSIVADAPVRRLLSKARVGPLPGLQPATTSRPAINRVFAVYWAV
jgi:hypothetical protein